MKNYKTKNYLLCNVEELIYTALLYAVLFFAETQKKKTNQMTFRSNASKLSNWLTSS